MKVSLEYQNKKPLKEIYKKINSFKTTNLNIVKKGDNYILIHQDNFIAMSSLLRTHQGKIDLIYIDPPFNTGQTFTVSKNRASTISKNKNGKIAYSDNYKLDEYLEFLRENIVIMRELLSDNGTLYLHIDIKVGHYVKLILDEVFGANNFLNEITRIKSNPKNFNRKAYGNIKDVIYVYAKKNGNQIFNNIKQALCEEEKRKRFEKVDSEGRRYTTIPCHAPGETKNGSTGAIWKGILPPEGRHWRSSPKELTALDENGFIEWSSNGNPRIKKYADEHRGKKIQDVWLGYKDPQNPKYPTEKNLQMLELIVKQSSNENSIIMDCFCGSGSFLKAGLNNNREVIGIDLSDVSIEMIKEFLEGV